jgi:hypothetical protein
MTPEEFERFRRENGWRKGGKSAYLKKFDDFQAKVFWEMGMGWTANAKGAPNFKTGLDARANAMRWVADQAKDKLLEPIICKTCKGQFNEQLRPGDLCGKCWFREQVKLGVLTPSGWYRNL